MLRIAVSRGCCRGWLLSSCRRQSALRVVSNSHRQSTWSRNVESSVVSRDVQLLVVSRRESALRVCIEQ